MNDILVSLIKQFMPFAQQHIGFKKPPRLFLRTDEKNAQNPLGKTAYYDPQERSVTLYVSGRHPKDIYVLWGMNWSTTSRIVKENLRTQEIWEKAMPKTIPISEQWNLKQIVSGF